MTTITIDLDDEEVARLKALEGRTGLSADGVVREALEVLSNALEFLPPYSAPEVAAIEAGIAAAERGEVSLHDDVFERLRRKYGE